MRKRLLPAILILFISALFVATGCKKKDTATANTPPTITTTDVISTVTATSALSGGTVVSIGSGSLTANGVCYSTSNHTPTITDSLTKEPLIYYTYTFSSALTNLKPSTVYYVRAYATNAFGTSYGKVVQFTTSSSLSSVTGAVTTFAGSATAGNADGTGTAASFSNPAGIAVDATGNIYVADSFNNRIRKITPEGVVTTLAGSGTAGYADGDASTAQFYGPRGLAVDATGNVFVADFGNNMIRKITPAGVVSTLAGNGTAGYIDGAGTVAEFSSPAGVAVDAQGNVFVADYNNNMIRKVTSAGVVSRIAGVKTAGYIDVLLSASTGVYGSFKNPSALTLDAAGNIYVADIGNNAIREITSTNVITVGGGPGQPALLGYPAGITMDATGNLFITDESGRILELTAAKVLYVLAGNPNVTGFTDGSGTGARFNAPQGITVDKSGNIFVADVNNNSIRKVVVVDVEN